MALDVSRENRNLPFSKDRNARRGCSGDAHKHPRDVAGHVENHHEVMDVVIITRGNIYPASTGESAYNSRHKYNGGKRGGRGMVQKVLEEHDSETRTCAFE